MDFIVQNAMKTQQDMKQQQQFDVHQANIKVIGTGGAGNIVRACVECAAHCDRVRVAVGYADEAAGGEGQHKKAR